MSEMSPGWYHDPAPANPATPGTMRFWDGRQWTARVRAAKRSEIAEMRQALEAKRAEQARMAYAGAAGYAPPEGAPTGAPTLGYGYAHLSPRDVTPDGEVLAGWWSRVGAFVVDFVIRAVLVVVVGLPFTTRIVAAYRDLLAQTSAAASAGGAVSPDLTHDFTTRVLTSMILLGLLAVAVQLLYAILFLKACAATPGKMLVGLKVRLRERPGPLPWGTVVVRCLVQDLALLLAMVPLAGLVLSPLYSLLNSLWPVWDGRRQGLHDKAARTNVVRVR